MTRVAVTGGTGFVGANLVRRLLAEGDEVHLLVRPGHHTWRLDDVLDDLHRREVDLGARDELAALVHVMAPDQVFHLAAHGAYPWQTDEPAIRATNVIGTDNLVHACVSAGVRAFVNTGSSSEYGARDHAPTEDEAAQPDSYYGLTKAWGTLACRLAGFTTLRLYSVYGPWEDPRRFVPQLVEHALEGRLPPLAHPGTARDFVHVDDVVDALLLAADAAAATAADADVDAAEASTAHAGAAATSSGTSATGRPPPGPVYNVGTGVQTTLREAVAVARQVLGVDVEPAWDTLASRPWDTDVWVADRRRIERDLGWRPRTGFAEGFARTVEWHRAQQQAGQG